MPWLTVIVPVHDGERHLPAALDSILMQRDVDLEVIAVDDHSTDRSAAILEEYSKRLPLIRLRPPAQLGWVGATNLALDAARGSHVCFLHQDDLWLPDRCALVKGVFETLPEIDLVIHGCAYVDDSGSRIGRLRSPLGHSGRLSRTALFEALLVQNFVAAPAATFSLAAARRVGPLDTSLWYAADWALWLALSSSADSFLLERELAAFRIHPRSQTASRSVDVAGLTGQLRRVLSSALQSPLQIEHPRSTRAAAELSILINGVLAALWNRKALAALRELASIRPRHVLGLRTFLRNSRLHERAGARLALLIGR